MITHYRLVIKVGPSAGQELPIEKPEVTLGRDQSADLVIADPEVSRRHCRLFMQGDGYSIEDLGSTNGTFVNNQRVLGPYPLRSGELINLGEHITLYYEVIQEDPDATRVGAAQHAPASMPTIQPPAAAHVPAPAPVPPAPAAPAPVFQQPPAPAPQPPAPAPMFQQNPPVAPQQPAQPEAYVPYSQQPVQQPQRAPQPPAYQGFAAPQQPAQQQPLSYQQPVPPNQYPPYAGQVPGNPPPSGVPFYKKLPTWALILIIALIVLVVLCVVPFIVIDLTNQWCNLFGDLFNGMSPGVCP